MLLNAACYSYFVIDDGLFGNVDIDGLNCGVGCEIKLQQM